MDKTPAIFNRLYKLYYVLVYSIAKRMLGDKEAAQDATADAFIGLWRMMENVEPGNEKAFLCTSVRNKCLDIIKGRKNNILKLDGYSHTLTEIDIEYAEVNSEIISPILALYEKQTPRRKEIFRLVYFERKTHREAAIALGIARLTVSNTIMDMLKILRNGAVDI